MGLPPYPLPCHSEMQSQSHSGHFHSDHPISPSSQPSFRSVSSFASQSSRQQQQTSLAHYQCISTLQGQSSSVFSLALSGKFLYGGTSDKEIQIWNHDSLETIRHSDVISKGNGAVKSLVISGNKLFSAHQDSKIRVWEIENDPNQKYNQLATLPTLGDRVMKLLPAKNYVQVRRHKKCTWVHHVDAVSALVLSGDDSLLYSASWDRTFKIWQTSDYRCLESVSNAHDDAINAIVVTNSGVVYTGSADKKIKVWKKVSDNKKHSLVGILEKHQSSVNALALSSDGLTLYSGACDRSIVVWEKNDDDGDSDDGNECNMVVVSALRGHSKAILCLAVVADLVCSGSADKTIRIWRRGYGRSYSCLAVLEGHRGPVKCLTAEENYGSTSSSSSSTSSYLVYSGGLDCNIKVWQISVPIST